MDKAEILNIVFQIKILPKSVFGFDVLAKDVLPWGIEQPKCKKDLTQKTKNFFIAN
jgi:hypothetical protein